MKHEIIYELYTISCNIRKLNTNIEYDQKGIEKLKKDIESYENGIKHLKDQLDKICTDNDINIDSLL